MAAGIPYDVYHECPEAMSNTSLGQLMVRGVNSVDSQPYQDMTDVTAAQEFRIIVDSMASEPWGGGDGNVEPLKPKTTPRENLLRKFRPMNAHSMTLFLGKTVKQPNSPVAFDPELSIQCIQTCFEQRSEYDRGNTETCTVIEKGGQKVQCHARLAELRNDLAHQAVRVLGNRAAYWVGFGGVGSKDAADATPGYTQEAGDSCQGIHWPQWRWALAKDWSSVVQRIGPYIKNFDVAFDGLEVARRVQVVDVAYRDDGA
ncbi:hypothetical protein K439DRAFT_1656910 [Ramaria rubella]|nr:hypothetical protein K439DRAFT_1656910 [Ramaria rubella]